MVQLLFLKSIPEEYYCFNCRKRTTNGQTTSKYSIPKLSNLSDEIQHSKFQYNSYPVRKGSNLNNKSLLKRRIIYGILAVCITLSKTSLASNETENEELSSHSVINGTGKIYNHIV